MPATILGPKWWFGANHGTQVASILCGAGRGDPRARGLLPLGGLVFATDQADPIHEDRYGLVERFVKDHRAVVLSSSSSNWGGQSYIKHYDGYSFLLDDLVLEYDLLICEAIGNTRGSGNGNSGSWAKNALLVVGVSPRGSLRREDHRHGVFASGPAPDGRVKPDLVHFGRNVYCADASSTRGYGPFGGTPRFRRAGRNLAENYVFSLYIFGQFVWSEAFILGPLSLVIRSGTVIDLLYLVLTTGYFVFAGTVFYKEKPHVVFAKYTLSFAIILAAAMIGRLLLIPVWPIDV